MPAEMLHPGTYITETSLNVVFPGVGLSTAGFVGTAEKGPTNEAKFITNFGQYIQTFGSVYNSSGTVFNLAVAVKQFFEQGGTRCWIVRVLASDAVTSQSPVPDSGGFGVGTGHVLYDVGNFVGAGSAPGSPGAPPQNTVLTAQAAYPGAWGQDVALDFTKVKTRVRASLSPTFGPTSTSLKLDSLAGIEVGDIVEIYDDTSPFAPTSSGPYDIIYSAIVKGIDTANTAIQVAAATTAHASAYSSVSITGGELVLVTSEHRFRGKLSQVATGTTTSITLSSVAGLVPGQLLYVIKTDTTALGTENGYSGASTILNIVGNTVYFNTNLRFNANDSSAGLAVQNFTGGVCNPTDPHLVVSCEFPMKVHFGGTQVESHHYIAAAVANQRDYYANRFQGTNNESKYVVLAAGTQATHVKFQQNPFGQPVGGQIRLGRDPFIVTSLGAAYDETTGTDGTTPVTTDYTGETQLLLGNKRGLELIRDLQDVRFLGVPSDPGDDDLIRYATAMCESKASLAFYAETPASIATAIDAHDFRQNTLQVDSSYACLWFPWLQITDPVTGVGTINVPPTGALIGVAAQKASTVGPHAPGANVAFKGSITGLTYNVTDAEHDILNPAGVNVIRSFPGRGIRPYGARTLWSIQDGRQFLNVRMLLIYIEETLKTGNADFVFQPINTDLFDALKAANKGFLHAIWQKGWLYPANDASKAYLVKVDSETTTDADLTSGIVNVQIMVSPPPPAEKIAFNVEVSMGGIKVTEAVV